MSLARRSFLKYSSAGLLSTTLLNSCRNTESVVDPDRPNIIVLIADDLRWDCIGKLNALIQTPNIDRLADQGIFFAIERGQKAEGRRRSGDNCREIQTHSSIEDRAYFVLAGVLNPKV